MTKGEPVVIVRAEIFQLLEISSLAARFATAHLRLLAMCLMEKLHSRFELIPMELMEIKLPFTLISEPIRLTSLREKYT